MKKISQIYAALVLGLSSAACIAGVTQFEDRFLLGQQALMSFPDSFNDFPPGYSYPGANIIRQGIRYTSPPENVVIGPATGYVPASPFMCSNGWTPTAGNLVVGGENILGFDTAMIGSVGPALIIIQTNLGTYQFMHNNIPHASTKLMKFTGFKADPGEVIFSYVIHAVNGPGSGVCVDNVVHGTTNALPTANAGPNQSVAEGALVQLSGSANSPIGLGFNYLWTQVAGQPVTLSNASIPNPTFRAPYLNANTTLTFKLTVRDSRGQEATSTVNIGVEDHNNPPIADAGNSGTIREGAEGQLNGSNSYDPDAGDTIAGYQWTQSGGASVTLTPNNSDSKPKFVAPLGAAGTNLSFDLKVSDGKEWSQSSRVNMAIVGNSAPIANAGTVQSANENTLIALNGGGSTDPDGDAISFQWQQVGGPAVTLSSATAPAPSFQAPWVNAGGAQLVFALTVTDNDPANPKSSTANVAVNVLNAGDPPSCTLARPSASAIWPPNHLMVPVVITGIADPDATNIKTTITSITQDEAINGLGDGDTAPDAIVQTGTVADSVLLRAERDGRGNGRVYTVHFTARNAEGMCNGSVKVGVPQSRQGTAVDGGQAIDSAK